MLIEEIYSGPEKGHQKLQYKQQTDICFAVRLGDDLLGQVFKGIRGDWSAVSWRDERTEKLYPVKGFKTLRAAALFLLKDSNLDYETNERMREREIQRLDLEERLNALENK